VTRALCLVLGLAAGAAGPASAQRPAPHLTVAASILPLADFAREVGGQRVSVEVLVPPGASPHTYEPTPAQLVLLSRANVLVLNGIGLEFWADKVIAAAHNPRLIVVRTAAGLPILAGDADEPGGNPHVWLSPQDAIHQVEAIRDGLIRADSAGAAVYRANADRFAARLRALDAEIRDTVATFRTRAFIAFHPAWAYFARDYGLREAAVIEASPGREPSPAEVAGVIQTARAIGARAIFAEPQYPTKAAQVIAEETGARVLLLDSLGRPPTYGYLETMRYDLAQMASALR
jgi:zinc transport system substrate-binding protein